MGEPVIGWTSRILEDLTGINEWNVFGRWCLVNDYPCKCGEAKENIQAIVFFVRGWQSWVERAECRSLLCTRYEHAIRAIVLATCMDRVTEHTEEEQNECEK